MMQGYSIQLKDRTGRSEWSTATGNTARIAMQAAALNATIPRSENGLGMMAPIQITGLELEG